MGRCKKSACGSHEFCTINVLAALYRRNSLFPLQQSVRWDKFSTWGNKLLAVERGQQRGRGGCPGRHRPVCECTWCTGHAGPNWNAFRIKSIKVSKKYLKREWPKFIPWVDRVKLQWNKKFPKISRKMGRVDRSMSKGCTWVRECMCV